MVREEASKALTEIKNSINFRLMEEINMANTRNGKPLKVYKMVESKILWLIWFTIYLFDGVTTS